MPTIISSGNRETFCLDGYRRLIIGLTAAPPVSSTGPVDIAIAFKIKTSDVEGTPLLAWVRKLGGAEDFIEIEADLGSYMIRPQVGIRVVAPRGAWSVAAWASPDPSLEPETFWRTVVVPAGPWVPPRFYHRLRLLSGTLTFQGFPLPIGFNMWMPGSGSALAAGDGGALVQIGFTI